MSSESLEMSGHGSGLLHEYLVYAVNPVFGPALLGGVTVSFCRTALPRAQGVASAAWCLLAGCKR